MRPVNGFMVGSVVALFTGLAPAPGGLAALALLLLALLLERIQRCARIWSVVLGMLAGLAWGGSAVERGLAGWLPPHLAGETLMVTGVVADLPVYDGQGYGGQSYGGQSYGGQGRVRFLLQRVQWEGEASEWPRPGDLRLTWHDPGMLFPGDRVRLSVTLQPPRGQVNQGSFDRARLDLARGIGARGSVQVMHERQYRPHSLAAWRARTSQSLIARLAGQPLGQRVLPALVAADRRGLSEDDWRLLQRTGTAHLMAISGLHISLVAMLVWGLSRVLLVPWLAPRGRSAHRWATLPAMLAAIGYALLAGFALPAQRALIMTLLLLLAITLGRRPATGHGLRLALVALLFYAPLSVLDNGFWLSFGAVALLIHALPGGGRWPFWARLLRTQGLVSMALGALTGWLFALWGLLSPLANLIMVPLFSLLLIPLLLAGALLPGAAVLLQPAARLLELCWWIMGFLDQFSPLLPVPQGVLVVVLLGLSCTLLLAPRAPWPRSWAVVLCLPWLWPVTDVPPPGGFDVILFDVGQGQAVAIRTREGLLLYDLGPGWPGGDAGRTIIGPWLARQRQPLTKVFISHGDQDHAGGLASLGPVLAAVPLYAGEPDRLPGTRLCKRGQHWQQGGIDVRVLWPPSGLPLERSNNRSCVVQIQGAYGSILLTGDIYKPVEYWLAAQDDLKSDLLLVPHHGSATSSSYAFLRAVAPVQAFVSAGHANRFGHPAGTVRSRYAELGIPLWVSSETGMIVFPVRGSHNPAPLLLRERLPVAWRPQRAQW